MHFKQTMEHFGVIYIHCFDILVSIKSNSTIISGSNAPVMLLYSAVLAFTPLIAVLIF